MLAIIKLSQQNHKVRARIAYSNAGKSTLSSFQIFLRDVHCRNVDADQTSFRTAFDGCPRGFSLFGRQGRRQRTFTVVVFLPSLDSIRC